MPWPTLPPEEARVAAVALLPAEEARVAETLRPPFLSCATRSRADEAEPSMLALLLAFGPFLTGLIGGLFALGTTSEELTAAMLRLIDWPRGMNPEV